MNKTYGRLGIGFHQALAIMLVGALSVSAADPAFAQAANQILTDSCNKVRVIRTWFIRIAYIIGVIGLGLVAVSAYVGRFKFSHLFAVGGGIFVVASADALISFLDDGGVMSDDCTVF